MGAGGSVIEESDEVDYPPGKSIASPSSTTFSVSEKAKSSPSDVKNVRQPKDYPQPTFLVSIGFWPPNLPKVSLPPLFKLQISYESLDFVTQNSSVPIIQFPFQNIICWGSSTQTFQFKVFNTERSGDSQRENGILISVRTSEGKKIEDATMEMVQKLMVDMNQRAISKREFAILLDSIFEGDGNTQLELREDWMMIIDQFTSSGRCFLAKQGMELLIKIGPLVPFEKFDLACLLYDRIINKNSFQLLVNTFEDAHDRENLVHRLQLNKANIVTTCAILPET
jgi:hypothetical protein